MSGISDKRKQSMFSLRNIWHAKQKNFCLKIWQLTLRHLKTCSKHISNFLLLAVLFKCSRTVWRDNAKPIWKACSSLFRKHFASEQIRSYSSQKAEDYERK